MIKLLKLLNHAFHPPTACFLVTYTHICVGGGEQIDTYAHTYIFMWIYVFIHIYITEPQNF